MSEQLYQQQRQHLLQHPLFSWPGLGIWSFYFLCKIGAGLAGYIELNLLWNFVLVALLVVPAQPMPVRVFRQLVAIAAAVILLYQETNLPPFSRLLDQWELVSAFSGWYTIELLGRFVSIEAIAIFLVALIVFLYARKVLRMTTVTVALLIAYPLLPSGSGPINESNQAIAGDISQGLSLEFGGANNPDSVLSRFFAQQSQIRFTPPTNVTPDFDILLLNICSLSWQDLEQFDLLDHPLWNSSDILLSNFYTGSSYSGPATLRLLQASCGHRPHSQIFEPEGACFINEQLAEIGFSSEIRMNHSGAFDNYLSQVRELGGMGDAHFVDPARFPISMTGFDQSPIRADSAILGDWLGSLNNEQPKFTFYNTTSLHDGNRLPGFRGNSITSYRTRVATLLDDIMQLFRDIEESGRNVLVVIVPEHGAGLQGDRFQLPGMREIPTPALTHVPVAFKLFGDFAGGGATVSAAVGGGAGGAGGALAGGGASGGFTTDGANDSRHSLVNVSIPTGPSAITQVIYEIIRQRPFSNGTYQPEQVARTINETLPVLENDRVIMVNVEGQFFLQINNGEWRPYNR